MKKLFSIVLVIAFGYAFAYFFVGKEKGYEFAPDFEKILNFDNILQKIKEKQKQKKLADYNEKFQEAMEEYYYGDYWSVSSDFYDLFEDTDSLEPLYWAAMSELKDEYYSSAITYFQELINLDFENKYDSAFYNLGQAFYWNSEFENARDAFKNYLIVYPSDEYALDWLAWCFYKTDEYDSAYFYEQKALEINPNYPDGYYGIAHFKIRYTEDYDISTQKEKKLLKEAIKYNWKVFSLDSLYYEAYYENGKAYYYLANYDSSVYYMNEYFDYDPTDESTITYLAKDFYYLKDTIALKSLQEKIDVDSLNEKPTYYLAKLQFNNANYVDASENFFLCYKISDDANYLIDIAKCYQKMGNNSDAIDILNKYLDESIDDSRKQEALDMLQELDDEL